MIITNRKDLIPKYQGRDIPPKNYPGYLIRLKEFYGYSHKPGDIVQFTIFDEDGGYRGTDGSYYERIKYAMLDTEDIKALSKPLFPI